MIPTVFSGRAMGLDNPIVHAVAAPPDPSSTPTDPAETLLGEDGLLAIDARSPFPPDRIGAPSHPEAPSRPSAPGPIYPSA